MGVSALKGGQGQEDIFMKEKINRLAKGIMENDRPEAELFPASFDEEITFGESGRREFQLRSKNGIGVKGLCYSDNPRVLVEDAVITGNRNRIIFRVDPSFLKEGTVIYGRICLITNAGEFTLPYRFTATGTSVYDRREETEEEFTVVSDNDPRYQISTGGSLTEFQSFLLENLPEDDELLSELAALLIREQQTDLFAFRVYEEAVARDIKLTRLYEYYIYAFPDDFTDPIPKEVLLYFSYDNTLDRYLKSVIYKNILTHFDSDSEIYKHYEPEMRDYALRSVLRGKIDDRLAVIYEHMIYPDMIDEHIARILPAVLKTVLIHCPDIRMSKVVVRYPELQGEEIYPIKDGRAYVPLYFPEAEVLFMDHYGRYCRGVHYEKTAVMNRPELLRRCFEQDPGHPMVRLSAAREILRKGVSNEQEMEVLLDVMKTLPLRESFREKIAEALIDFGGSMEFISEIHVDQLSGSQKQKIFRSLVKNGEPEQAYAMIRRYGLLIAEHDSLRELLLSLIREGRIPQEEKELRFFVSACRRVFDEGTRDKELLSCLCRVYEGSTEDMYRILEEAEKAGAETDGMAERVLITKLFADVREHLDETFTAYLKGQPEELLLRAYFTVRCSDYFVEDRELPELFFEELQGYLSGKKEYGKLPSIYLLAWTKHYAREGSRKDGDQKCLAGKLLEQLLSEGLTFSYMKRLSDVTELPTEFLEKNYIEYHGDRHKRPRLFIKIEPEDSGYHEEEMRRIYQGIYQKAVQLFSDDELHYRIYEEDASGEPVQEGVLSGKNGGTEVPGGRYGLLEQMASELDREDMNSLREHMSGYILREEMNRILFDVKE